MHDGSFFSSHANSPELVRALHQERTQRLHSFFRDQHLQDAAKPRLKFLRAKWFARLRFVVLFHVRALLVRWAPKLASRIVL